MKAEVEGEDSEYVKVHAWDNSGTEHELTVNKQSGEIEYHKSEGYANKAKERTNEGNEHVNQAARFAKYYVYRERGYDTLTPYENPDRLAAVALAINAMGTETFETYFGDCYGQIRSHHTDETPPVTLPESIDPEDVLFYRQHVYLGLDADDVSALAELFAGDAMERFFERAQELDPDDEDARATLQSLAEEIEPDISTDAVDEDFLIEGVSDVHIRWDEGLRERLAAGDDPHDRDPDARLELFPQAYNPDSIETFQRHLVHHLKCQIRDCYVGMGLTPPEAVQLTGPGQYTYSNWYEHYDVYQPYHDPDAAIQWNTEPEPTPAE